MTVKELIESLQEDADDMNARVQIASGDGRVYNILSIYPGDFSDIADILWIDIEEEE